MLGELCYDPRGLCDLGALQILALVFHKPHNTASIDVSMKGSFGKQLL